jgi:hypothetical protein
MDRIWEQYQSIEKTIGASMRAASGLLRAVESPLTQLGVSLQPSAVLPPGLEGTIRVYADVSKALGSKLESAIGITTALGTHIPHDSLSSRILVEHRRWETLVQRVASSPLHRIARESHLNWMQTVAEIEEQFSLWESASIAPAYVYELLAPSEYLAQFSRRTLVALQRASESQSIGLQASLAVAQYELVGLPSLMSPLIEEADADDGCALAMTSMNAGRVWRRELVAAAIDGDVVIASDEGIQQLVDSSTGVDLTARIRYMLSLIPECNEAAKCAGRPEIFKLSNQMVGFMCSAHFDLATNRERLRNFVINMCMMIYEAGGKEKYNYRGKGLLSDEESWIVDTICDLRNKWLGHDPEQVREVVERRNYAEVRKRLLALGVDRFPTRAEHFLCIQRAIVECCTEMLEMLLDRVGAFP